MSDFGWDAESKGELAVVEGGRRVKGLQTDRDRSITQKMVGDLLV